MRAALPLIALSLSLGACIPKGKYDESLAQRDDLQVQLDTANGTIGDLRAELTGRDGRIASLQQEVAATQNSLDELSRQLASKIAEAGALQASVEEMEQALKGLGLAGGRR